MLPLQVPRNAHPPCTAYSLHYRLTANPRCPFVADFFQLRVDARNNRLRTRYFVFVSARLTPGLAGYGHRLNVIRVGSTAAAALSAGYNYIRLVMGRLQFGFYDAYSIYWLATRDFVLSVFICTDRGEGLQIVSAPARCLVMTKLHLLRFVVDLLYNMLTKTCATNFQVYTPQQVVQQVREFLLLHRNLPNLIKFRNPVKILPGPNLAGFASMPKLPEPVPKSSTFLMFSNKHIID